MTMHPIIKRARDEGRVFLTEPESKELLGQSGIAIIDTVPVKSRQEAVATSEKIGYPAVLKIISPDIIHKTDAGGIKLDLQNPEQVEAAYNEIIASVKQKHPQAKIQGISVQKKAGPGVEIIIGMHKDMQFGPVLLFGLGGILTEVLEDTSLRVTPITRYDAREMIEEIKGYKLLKGFRGQPPVKIEALEDMLLAVSTFVEENPEIKELDINPVIATENGAVAVDARVVLEDERQAEPDKQEKK